MEYRRLGASGLRVPALGFGAGTFGGRGPLFSAWGNTDVAGARRIVDICLDAGVNLFDTADVYSSGASESILGAAIQGRRDKVIVSTKLCAARGGRTNDVGSSRHHLIRGVDAALRRLGTDTIDLLQLHAFDAMTPVEQVLAHARRSGPRRQGALHRRVEFLGLAVDEVAGRVGPAGPLALCRQPDLLLAGRPRLRVGADAARSRPGHRRNRLEPARLGPPDRQDPARPAAAGGSRLHDTAGFAPPVDEERLYRVVDAMDTIAEETGKTLPQIATCRRTGAARSRERRAGWWRAGLPAR